MFYAGERSVFSWPPFKNTRKGILCHPLSPAKKKKDTNLLSWFLLTAHTKQMQKYQVYVFCKLWQVADLSGFLQVLKHRTQALPLQGLQAL